jgi:hypothetical protein
MVPMAGLNPSCCLKRTPERVKLVKLDKELLQARVAELEARLASHAETKIDSDKIALLESELSLQAQRTKDAIKTTRQSESRAEAETARANRAEAKVNGLRKAAEAMRKTAARVLQSSAKRVLVSADGNRQPTQEEVPRKPKKIVCLLLERCYWILNHPWRARVQGKCAGSICTITDSDCVHDPWNNCTQGPSPGERHLYYSLCGFTSVPFSVFLLIIPGGFSSRSFHHEHQVCHAQPSHLSSSLVPSFFTNQTVFKVKAASRADGGKRMALEEVSTTTKGSFKTRVMGWLEYCRPECVFAMQLDVDEGIGTDLPGTSARRQICTAGPLQMGPQSR